MIDMVAVFAGALAVAIIVFVSIYLIGQSRHKPCTCHPGERPPICQRRYAASECRQSFNDWIDLQ